MSNESQNSVDSGIRILAFLLIAGGIVGALLTGVQVLNQLPLLSGFTVVAIIVFIWSTLKGFDLWRGRPTGYKWAKILFGSQVPFVSIPYFEYEFLLGLGFRIIYGRATYIGVDTDLYIGFAYGGTMNFLISPEIQSTALGINVIALIGFVYLIRNRA